MYDNKPSLPKRIIEDMKTNTKLREDIKKIARNAGFEGEPEAFIVERFTEVSNYLLDSADSLLKYADKALEENKDALSPGETEELNRCKIIVSYLKSRQDVSEKG